MKAAAGWYVNGATCSSKIPGQGNLCLPRLCPRNKIVARGSQKPCEESNEVRGLERLTEDFTFSPAPPLFLLTKDTRYLLKENLELRGFRWVAWVHVLSIA